MGKVSDFRALIWDYRLNGMTKTGTPVFVTFSFLDSAEVPSLEEYEPFANTGYSGFTSTQKLNFFKALSEYERVSGMRFIEVDDPEDATFLVMNTAGAGNILGWANIGNGTSDGTSQGYLVINHAGSYKPGTVAFETILHELGHVAGFKHPHDPVPRLVDRLDNEDHTLMSYESNYHNDTTLAHLDIDALHYLYGRSNAVKATWSWHFDELERVFHLSGGKGADRLIGTDTDTRIEGRGSADRIFGRDEDDTAFGQSGDDRFMLGLGDNTAYGGVGNDRFVNHWGNDRFDGGSGIDTVTFMRSSIGVTVDLGLEDPQWAMGEDTFIFIENVVGSMQADGIEGSDVGNTISGRAGDDVLFGDDGDDRILGQRGNDDLDGGAGDDTLIGGAGNDTLTGGLGEDVFIFRPSSGDDDVTDFVDGEDLLAFYGFGFARPVAALRHFYEIGTDDDGMIAFEHGDTSFVLHGANLADMSRADILI